MAEVESNLNVLGSFPRRTHHRIHGVAHATRIKGLSYNNAITSAVQKGREHMGCITLGNRQMMIQTIKTIIEPYLRAHGFKGSYPHFRRKQDFFQEILMIYMTRYSEDFYIETSIVPLTGYVDIEGDTILPNKVKVYD